MKHIIRQLLKQSLHALAKSGEIDSEALPATIPVERPRRDGQGDYASGIALAMARAAKRNPKELAALIQDKLPVAPQVAATQIAGPGFINFFLTERALTDVIAAVLDERDSYGTGVAETPQKILLEYVSANPTGPLHVGHGRGAAFGDALARLLRAAGHQVDTEYYVNDIGRQMDILTLSVWIRYLQIQGIDESLPQAAYQGSYIREIAARVDQCADVQFDFAEGPRLVADGSNDDARLDSLIRQVRKHLGTDQFNRLRKLVLDEMVAVIRADLEKIGVTHDRWFFESEVTETGELEAAFDCLKSNGYLYEADGATWFRSSQFGDEKDRVLRRSNGGLTYFASDVAYHLNKLRRGHDLAINIWGADHHGYIARMKAAMQAGGQDALRLRIFIVQFAALWRGKEKIPMSTRAGEFVSLEEMTDEIGKDATRFFYALRKPDQHLDFDLQLAKAQSNENPVYYVQYAHARICSLFSQMSERGIQHNADCDSTSLVEEVELNLIRQISRFPEVVESAAQGFEPHQIAYYLRDLATDFHSFYNRVRVLDCEAELRNARLNLIGAVQQVLVNGLHILGVSAPKTM